MSYGSSGSSASAACTKNDHLASSIRSLTRQAAASAASAEPCSWPFATMAASNTATNNNSGANFTLIGVATPTVLLVDDYDTAAEEADGSTVIPDGSYTNVLAAAGVSGHADNLSEVMA